MKEIYKYFTRYSLGLSFCAFKTGFDQKSFDENYTPI